MRALPFTFALLFVLLAGSVPAQSNGYPRAILRGDYPDPTILRDGDDYYMTHSAFLFSPGFLIWHSKDLINWEPVSRAMTDVVGSTYAPDLAKVNGKFYLYFPASRKIWVMTADNIHGPWSKPVQLDAVHIDPGHAVGEDGKRYLFLSGGNMVPLSDDGLKVAGEMQSVYNGWEFPKSWVTEGKGEMFLESPKVFRKGDYFYLVSAEGGTAGPPTSHMVVVARSKSIHGPWENSPYNPLVHTYSADEQWWSKGHGTIVDDVNGNWWVVYHAYENGQHPLGRQTLLDSLDWTEDGWPVLAKTPHPLPPGGGIKGGMQLSDDFAGSKLGLQWTTWRNYAGISLRNQSLYLTAKGTSPKDARLLLVTATDHSYEVQTEVAVPQDGSGGLVLFYSEKAFAGVSSDGKSLTIYRSAKESSTQTNEFGSHFFLRLVNQNNRCDYFASGDGKKWMTVASGVDVSEMNHNKLGGFLALRPALTAAGVGEVKFNQFQYQGFADGHPLKLASEPKPN